MVYPPLGLWYLAALLEKLGHKVDFFDLSEDELPKDGMYDQIWVSATSPQMHSVQQLGEVFRGYEKTSTVLGGPIVWARPEKCEDIGFDVIVSGEADIEWACLQVMQSAAVERGNHRSLLLVVGTQVSLDHILPPVRRWSHRYHAYLEDKNGNKYKTTTMFTSRGCPMACLFCESGRNGVIWSKYVRYEPLDIVEAQMSEIKSLGYDAIMYYDDILPLNKPRTLRILDLHKKYGLKWRCFLRTDVITKQGGYDYLKEMRDAGLLEVLAGVETGDNRIKKNVSKGTTIEQDTKVLRWCRELGIAFKASIILGLPGEDMESMRRTRDWILQNKPDRVDVNTLIPFPGTPITDTDIDLDLYWTEEWPEELWYKGPRDISQAIVGTSSLTPDQIGAFRDGLIKEIEAAGIPY